MKNHRDTLEELLEDYSTRAQSAKSYITELTKTTAKHGTEPAQFEEDLHEAEHNARYYDGEIARLKKEIAQLPAAKPGNVAKPGGIGRIAKAGLLALSPIGFLLVGALLGSKLKSRRESREN